MLLKTRGRKIPPERERKKISVENGIATLTGYVSTFVERQAFEENAYERGAKEAINKLRVTNMQFGLFYPDGFYGKLPPERES